MANQQLRSTLVSLFDDVGINKYIESEEKYMFISKCFSLCPASYLIVTDMKPDNLVFIINNKIEVTLATADNVHLVFARHSELWSQISLFVGTNVVIKTNRIKTFGLRGEDVMLRPLAVIASEEVGKCIEALEHKETELSETVFDLLGQAQTEREKSEESENKKNGMAEETPRRKSRFSFVEAADQRKHNLSRATIRQPFNGNLTIRSLESPIDIAQEAANARERKFWEESMKTKAASRDISTTVILKALGGLM
jgi:hypothetical protein